MPATTFRGQPSHMRSRMALGQLADQQIELIQPLDDTPTVYSEFLDNGGRGVHHVCYWYDVDSANEILEGRGHELVQDGLTTGGDRFSYLAAPFGPPYVEVVDPTGGSGSMAKFFAAVAAAAVDWDGTDPVRTR